MEEVRLWCAVIAIVTIWLWFYVIVIVIMSGLIVRFSDPSGESGPLPALRWGWADCHLQLPAVHSNCPASHHGLRPGLGAHPPPHRPLGLHGEGRRGGRAEDQQRGGDRREWEPDRQWSGESSSGPAHQRQLTTLSAHSGAPTGVLDFLRLNHV